MRPRRDDGRSGSSSAKWAGRPYWNVTDGVSAKEPATASMRLTAAMTTHKRAMKKFYPLVRVWAFSNVRLVNDPEMDYPLEAREDFAPEGYRGREIEGCLFHFRAQR